MTTVLELRGITKTFPGVLANDNVNLTARAGRDPCLAGGKRRRQDHTDEHPLRFV